MLGPRLAFCCLPEWRATVALVSFGFGGVDASGDEVLDVVSLGIDTRVTRSSLSQQVIEDLQFFDFFLHAQLLGATGALESCERVTNDPPDLRLKLVGLPALGVELTSLSSTDVSKQRLAEVRSIERALNERLLDEPHRYPHLRGRYVCIFENKGDAVRPKKRTGQIFRQFVDQLSAVLAEDFGVVDHTPLGSLKNPDGTRMTTIPPEIAMKGRKFFEEYLLTVEAADDPNAPSAIRANCQITIRPSDLRERLIETVNAKDVPQNNILLISTGLPDGLGYCAIGDMYVSHLVEKLARSGLGLQPKHLDQVIFHHWRVNAITLYERSEVPKLVDSSIWPHLIAS